MLLTEKMQVTKFSESERAAVNFILQKGMEIEKYSTSEIAKQTFTSPSILIRVAKKLGFHGWNDLKKNYLEEVSYLESHFQSIDANYPFGPRDNMMTVANKIASLYMESAEDTLSLVEHDALQKAVWLLHDQKKVLVFAIGNLNYASDEFTYKMRRISRNVLHDAVQDNQFHDALMAGKEDVAICLSYSGETPTLLKTALFLKKKNVPIIAVTSLGNNSLSRLADIVLHVTTREKSYSKIAGFTSYQSVSLILDILYSCLFNMDYNRNLEYKVDIAKEVENDRVITNHIIGED